MGERIAVLGLGYVGLPVAIAMAGAHGRVLGFDIAADRIEALRRGHDATGEVQAAELLSSTIELTTDPGELEGCDVFILTVPTPIDANHQPDLRPLEAASQTVGSPLRRASSAVTVSVWIPTISRPKPKPPATIPKSFLPVGASMTA